MADKIYILVVHVDLSCCHCREKLQKYLCRMQCRESIFGIEYDEKKNTVTINGPFFNPHGLKERLMCKLPKVIKSIEIRDPQKEKEEKEKKEKEEKEKKEKEEKEKKEKEEKEKKEREEKIKKEKCKKAKCKEECKCEDDKPDPCKPFFIVKGRPASWQPASTDCCCRPQAGPCGSCGPCSCNRTGWNNDCRCGSSSCGMGAGQGGYCYGPTPPRPWDTDCKAIVVEDYPASCSIM